MQDYNDQYSVLVCAQVEWEDQKELLYRQRYKELRQKGQVARRGRVENLSAGGLGGRWRAGGQGEGPG
jgi:hypothetical protein